MATCCQISWACGSMLNPAGNENGKPASMDPAIERPWVVGLTPSFDDGLIINVLPTSIAGLSARHEATGRGVLTAVGNRPLSGSRTFDKQNQAACR